MLNIFALLGLATTGRTHQAIAFDHDLFFSFSRFLIFAFAAFDSRRVCGVWYLRSSSVKDKQSLEKHQLT